MHPSCPARPQPLNRNVEKGGAKIILCQGGRSCAKARGALPKSLDSDGNFKSQHTLVCRDIKICRDLRNFWKSLGKKSVILSKTVFLGQEMHYYMVCIAYYTELNLQICNNMQKQRNCRKKKVTVFTYTCLTKFYMAIFALPERLPTFATLSCVNLGFNIICFGVQQRQRVRLRNTQVFVFCKKLLQKTAFLLINS